MRDWTDPNDIDRPPAPPTAEEDRLVMRVIIIVAAVILGCGALGGVAVGMLVAAR